MQDTTSTIIALFAVLSVAAGRSVTGKDDFPSVISVRNGGPWGRWGPLEYCPPNSKATSFSLKVERTALVDLSAVNGIRLYCNGVGVDETIIESTVDRWGEWGPLISCEGVGFLTTFMLRVQAPNLSNDETAANNFLFQCNTGQLLDGQGLSRGSFGEWSNSCAAGICGLETKVQDPAGLFTDQTALNDVNFYCCP